MFDFTSRYASLPTTVFVGADGRELAYVRRRFVPDGSTLPVLAEVRVNQGDRIDLIAARTLGVPEVFWRIADANDALDPAALAAEPGRRLRVPAPQP
ncbi:LysM domain-containing protein [Actinomycetospora chibensis]|uniref:LysM domain-containing protein n=1 Tax=Actinomycetospora chibensis TaxID=663606 RepID=A0ABV9RLZ5_9PSEU|nr:LysM domain-containing protein [Actinomycetospora chibensis]MDD7926962.1 LysM domain-containing protein [Actinomycetospora chibensis]